MKTQVSNPLLAAVLICGMTACSSADQRAADPTAGARPTTAANATSAPAASAAAAAQSQPTPTFVPLSGQPQASAAPTAGSGQPQPPASPAAGSDQPQPPAAPAAGNAPIVLEDTAWQGGYRRASGNNVYGGRTAAWIYGTTTQFSTMQASFTLGEQPSGTATLSIEGMDSEGASKTPISITINGSEIYNGPNPLPNDDQPLETGTWTTYTWRFDAALLRPGQNTISISNLAPGAFSLPPFFMLDYAQVAF